MSKHQGTKGSVLPPRFPHWCFDHCDFFAIPTLMLGASPSRSVLPVARWARTNEEQGTKDEERKIGSLLLARDDHYALDTIRSSFRRTQ